VRATEKRSGGPFRPERAAPCVRACEGPLDLRLPALTVRKLSGFNRPSKANQAAFDRAIADVTHAAHHLLADLVSNAPPRDRAVEAAKAKARSAERFAKAG
jgi:hypothetical protein